MVIELGFASRSPEVGIAGESLGGTGVPNKREIVASDAEDMIFDVRYMARVNVLDE